MKLPTELTHRYETLNEHVAGAQDVLQVSGAASLVIQNGCIVNEWYRGSHDSSASSREISRDSQFNVGSVRKSYLGFAVSLAVHEGKVSSIDHPIADYLCDLDKDLFQGITIRHLLTHTDGVRYTERLFPVGTDWAYNNSGVNLLIRLVNEVYGCSLAELLEERVFRPGEFTETGWRAHQTACLVWQDELYTNASGTEANLFVSARELAYWGYLHLVGGRWGEQGVEIAHPTVFREAVTVQTPGSLTLDKPRNGFLWFVQDKPSAAVEMGDSLPLGSFQILGITGCACLVIPAHHVVAVRMYNQKGPNPPGYDYLNDIKRWGDLVYECATQTS